MSSSPRSSVPVAESCPVFDISWRESPAGPAIVAHCRFEQPAVRHAVAGHFAGAEPWGRVLNRSLVDRLAAAATAGRPAAAEDCDAFAEGMAAAMQGSGDRPVLCRYQETPLHYIDGDGRRRFNCDMRRREKVLFVLASGAVAFAEVVGSPWGDLLDAQFLTAFFPWRPGFVVPRRAAGLAVERYVLKYAEVWHESGGRLLPEPAEGVRQRDDETGVEVQREYFRFISPAAWGFEQQPDGEWVWFPPARDPFHGVAPGGLLRT